jgi:thiol-disulfide isomerase/thioredoxin
MSLPSDVSRSASLLNRPSRHRTPQALAATGWPAAAAGATGAGVAWWRFQPPRRKMAPSRALWKLSFDTPTGGAPLAMQALQGRPLLLNFWATWCPPAWKSCRC